MNNKAGKSGQEETKRERTRARSFGARRRDGERERLLLCNAVLNEGEPEENKFKSWRWGLYALQHSPNHFTSLRAALRHKPQSQQDGFFFHTSCIAASKQSWRKPADGAMEIDRPRMQLVINLFMFNVSVGNVALSRTQVWTLLLPEFYEHTWCHHPCVISANQRIFVSVQ